MSWITVFVEFLHVKPGKGAAFVRSKLKNVITGQVVEKTFRAGEKVAKATLDRREMQYLYKEGTAYVMMDNETYDQIHVEEAQIGSGVKYLKENIKPNDLLITAGAGPVYRVGELLILLLQKKETLLKVVQNLRH